MSADEDPARERWIVATLLARQVDALINAAASGDQSYLARDMAMGTAMVFVDRPPLNLDADTVPSTNAEGTAEAVEHPIRWGHTRIGFLGDRPQIPTAAERLEGYRSAITRAGLSSHPGHVVTELHSTAPAEAVTRDMMVASHPPTALLTAQNLITIGAVRALRSLGLAGRVALVGFDEVELADLLEPPVAVVAQDIDAMGRTAAGLAFERLSGERTGPGAQFRIPTEFVHRASADIPPETP